MVAYRAYNGLIVLRRRVVDVSGRMDVVDRIESGVGERKSKSMVP